MSRKKQRYAKQFKAEAIKLAQESGNVAQTARNLGVHVSTLNSWVKAASPQSPGGALAESEREELICLRKEAKVLRMERDFLKKTAQYFVRDSGRSK